MSSIIGLVILMWSSELCLIDWVENALNCYPPDFPGGTVVKNPPDSAGDTGLIPGRGRSHMPQSN